MNDAMFVTKTRGYVDQKTREVFLTAAVREKIVRQKNKDDGDIVTQEKTSYPL